MNRSTRPPLTRAALETLRDRTFHRLPHLRVRTEKDALRFIQRVGFCFTFRTFGYTLPCLYVAVCGRRHPGWPKHTHHHPAVVRTWDLKDTLPAKRRVYYGRVLKGKPTLVSLELFPAFVALIRDGRLSGDYLADYREGRLSRTALQLMDTLMETHPLDTGELRHRAGLGGPLKTRPFEKAMAELQRKLWVVKVEEVYDPYFCYRWDMVDNWLPGEMRRGLRLSRDEAIRQLVEQYLKTVIASQERTITRLFELQSTEVERALDQFAAEGCVARGVPIRNLPGRWLLWHPVTRLR